MENYNSLEYVKKIMQDKNVNIAELSNRTGIRYELLRRTLHGERKLTVDEFVQILSSLGFDLIIN